MSRNKGLIARCLLFVCGSGLAVIGNAGGQALPTATRPLRFQAYGEYTYARLDYVGAPSGTGFTVGAVTGLHSYPLFDLGLDVRGTSATSPNVNERTITGSLRATLNLGRLQPYIGYGGGGGLITFPKHQDPHYTLDSAFITGVTAGINADVTSHWSILADVNRQSWNLGTHSYSFQPMLSSFGVRYRVGGSSDEGPGSNSRREY